MFPRRRKVRLCGASLLLNVCRLSLSSNRLISGPTLWLPEIHFLLHGKPVKVVSVLNQSAQQRYQALLCTTRRHSTHEPARERFCHLWLHSQARPSSDLQLRSLTQPQAEPRETSLSEAVVKVTR